MVWAQVDEEQEDYFSYDDEDVASISGNESKRPKDEEQLFQDGDADIDTDIARTHGPETTTEKRAAQNKLMRAFVADLSARLTQKEVEEVTSKSVKEEQLSIRDIVAAQDSSVRITNPRDYQTELFQQAKSENIIAVLDTGSGKTHIATLLLRFVLEQELEHRAKGNERKTAFFLVRFVKRFLLLC